MKMSLSQHSIRTLLALTFVSTTLIAATGHSAQAALVRRTFELNASQTGSGFFDYDDSALTTDAFTGNQFSDILNAIFQFTGEGQQTLNDPFAAVNFDSAGNFLGIDLEIDAPTSALQSVLIANEDAFIPATAFTAESTTVTYGAPTAVPTPALLPGLVGLGLGVMRKKQKSKAA